MPSPFYPAIKGTTSGAPGTSAFTPNAAATGRRAWSTVPTGWIGPVRFDDVSNAWEEAWCYWDGTSLSRSTNQLIGISTGSTPLSLTSAATASLVVDPGDVMSHLGTTPWCGQYGNPGGSMQALGMTAVTALGTTSNPGIATTNLLTEQAKQQRLSATTANAQAGDPYATAFLVVNTTAGRGGWELVIRFGATTLPTGPRLFCGATSVSFSGNTAEPSALVAHVAAFTLDSTDTNIQLTTNSNAGAGTKIDTGIPWVANGLYEASLWTEPGSTTVNGLLIRIDTGAIWTNQLAGTTTDVPASGAIMMPQLIAGLNGTNTGTALTLQYCSMSIRHSV